MIRVKAIIEIAGFPKEHAEQTVDKVVSTLKGSFNLKNFKVYEAVALKEKLEGFWSSFCDVEVELKNIDELVVFCFDFMPSSIEIISPESLSLKQNEMGNIFNDLLSRLHNYDMLVKNLNASNQVLKKKLDESVKAS